MSWIKTITFIKGAGMSGYSKHIFVLMVCLHSLLASAGTDSLALLLKKAKSDQERCALLVQQIAFASDTGWQTYNEELKNISRRNLEARSGGVSVNEFRKYHALAVENSGVLSEKRGDIDGALHLYLSALLEYKLANDEPGKSACFNNIAFIYQGKGNMPLALRYNDSSLRIRLKIKDEKGIAESYNNYGIIYHRTGQIDKALECQFRNLEISQKLGDAHEVALACNNIGTLFNDLGEFEKAIDYLLKALRIYESSGRHEDMAFTLMNIGSIYYQQQEKDLALGYFMRSLKLNIKNNNQRGIASVLDNIGLVYQDRKKFDAAQQYFQRSLKIREQLGQSDGVALIYNHLGYNCSSQGKIRQALNQHKIAFELFSASNNKKGISSSLNYIGDCYLELGSLDEALGSYRRSLEIGREIKNPRNQMNAALGLKKTFAAKHNFEQALLANDTYSGLRDSINKEDGRRANLRKRLEYEFEKRQSEIEKEGEILKSEYARKKQVILILSGAAIAVVVLLFFLVLFRIRIKKLAEKNELLLRLKEMQVSALQSQMNPHFIFNSIGSALAFITSGESDKAVDYLGRFSRLLRFVLNNPEKKQVALKEEINFISLYVGLEQMRFNHSFEFNVTVGDKVDPENTDIPGMIIQPFVENAINHGILNKLSRTKGDYRPKLSIHFSLKEEKLICTVCDNGIGRKAAAEIKARFPEKNNSLGTRMAGERLQLLSNNHCKVCFEDLFEDGTATGTRVSVELPVLNNF